jgi:hypothetical protein
MVALSYGGYKDEMIRSGVVRWVTVHGRKGAIQPEQGTKPAFQNIEIIFRGSPYL